MSILPQSDLSKPSFMQPYPAAPPVGFAHSGPPFKHEVRFNALTPQPKTCCRKVAQECTLECLPYLGAWC
jgi:hypothetical protein